MFARGEGSEVALLKTIRPKCLWIGYLGFGLRFALRFLGLSVVRGIPFGSTCIAARSASSVEICIFDEACEIIFFGMMVWGDCIVYGDCYNPTVGPSDPMERWRNIMLNPLNPLIERLERNTQILRDFSKLLDADPTLVPLLREALGAHGNGHIDRNRTTTGRTLFDRIEGIFRDNGNAWTTTTELRSALKCTRGAISSVLYQTHQERFDVRSKPGSKKFKQFRLKGGGDREEG
mgnify:FL=1